jgi:hypothetical protein
MNSKFWVEVTYKTKVIQEATVLVKIDDSVDILDSNDVITKATEAAKIWRNDIITSDKMDTISVENLGYKLHHLYPDVDNAPDTTNVLQIRLLEKVRDFEELKKGAKYYLTWETNDGNTYSYYAKTSEDVSKVLEKYKKEMKSYDIREL